MIFALQGPPYVLGCPETSILKVVQKLGFQNNKITYLLQIYLYIKVQYVCVDQSKPKLQIKMFFSVII